MFVRISLQTGRVLGTRNISKKARKKAARMVTHNCSLDLSPPVNRTMRTLDKSFFVKEFDIKRARFDDPRIVQPFIRKHPQDVLSAKNIRNVIKLGNRSVRAVLLTDRLTDRRDKRNVLSESCLRYFEKNQISIQDHTLVLGYDNWTTEEILGAILPEELLDNIPSGFAQTGHIAHLNLREEYKPYKNLIGEIVLSKNPSVKTVVDKVDSIATEFRTFKMEVLAGEPNLLVTHKEQKCMFKFDFGKVYWNSRLQTEHEKLVGLFRRGQIIVDVMAGVGPFSVPAGKHEVITIANDLNPDSYHYLCENAKLNHVEKFVYSYNHNGHDVIKNCMKYIQGVSEANDGSIKVELKPKSNKKGKTIGIKEVPIPKFPTHFVMNLPDSAIEFMGDYNGIFADHEYLKTLPEFKLPTVHLYCFEKFSPDEPEPTEEELHERVRRRIAHYMDYDGLKLEDISFRLVRKVSPTKPMYRASFRLPEEVAFKKV